MKTNRSTPPRPEDQFAIRVLHGVNYLFTRIYHHLTVVAPARLPHRGPAIIVCNHISSLDPLLLQSACTYRLIMWMMAREYMTIPGMGNIFQTLQVIPVDRGSKETTPMRTALRQLSQGHIIGVFPEGRISTTGDLLDFQTGVALMAIRAKVPIFPAYLNGTQRGSNMTQAFIRRSDSTVCFGPAIAFDRSNTHRETLEAATVAIKSAVNQLRFYVDEARRVH